MRATCLQFGVRLDDLGTYALPWSDLAALIQWAPADSPIMRAVHPEVAEFATPMKTNQILADHFDATAWGNYQRAHGKGSRPKPYPRPGDRSKQRFGSRRMSRAEARRFLERRRQGLPAVRE